MLDFLIEGDYYEFPSFEMALFSILLSFVLSSAISFVYHLTNQGTLSRNFIQAMILSSIVTCMVIMAVGDNIAAGFGIMGAIAIVRFRMRIENPRNIIFIFGALSVGIALGVYGYTIAISGTIVFCIVAILLHFSSYGKKDLDKEFNLQFMLLREIDEGVVDEGVVDEGVVDEGVVSKRIVYKGVVSETLMKNFLDSKCKNYSILSTDCRNKGNKYDLFIMLKDNCNREEFLRDLALQEGFQNVMLERSDNLKRL